MTRFQTAKTGGLSRSVEWRDRHQTFVARCGRSCQNDGMPQQDSRGTADIEELDAHMLRAVESRTIVGQATGILMERYGLCPERAFDVLKRISSHSNTKLRLVAEHLVETGQLLDTGQRDSD